MLALIDAVLRLLRPGLQSRSQLMLEKRAPRHQLTVLRHSVPKPLLRNTDRWFWVLLQQCWSGWKRVLFVLQPQTVVAWHRLGFRLFWRWKSRPRGGRPTLDGQRISLLRHLWSSNPTWGSKRIQAELANLGIHFSDSTIRRYRAGRRRMSQTWKTFLHT